MIEDFDCERCGHLEVKTKFSPSVLEFSVLTRFVSSQERNGYTITVPSASGANTSISILATGHPNLLQPSVGSQINPTPGSRNAKG